MTASATVIDRVASLLDGPDALVAGGEVEGWAVGDRVPAAVAHPGSVEALARLLSRASEEGWAVAPAGAGSWLDGGGAPERLDLVVTTTRLGGVEHYEPGDLTLTAGAGLSVADLRAETGAQGQWLPQDPPGAGRGTLGALVATGLPGPLEAGFGRPRDQVLGVTVVTGDGRVLRPGGRVVKNVAGYDLVRLVVGSWGTLGIVAGASIRLYPWPERDATLLFREDRSEDLVGVARGLAAAPVTASSLELVEPAPGSAGPGGAAVLARVVGRSEEVSALGRQLGEAAGREPDEVAEGESSRELHRRLEDEGEGAVLELRLSLLPDRLPGLLRIADELVGGLRSAGAEEVRRSVHLTSGVLRLAAAGSPEAGGEPWSRILGRVRERLEEAGGGLRVVRGPGEVGRGMAAGSPGDGRDRLAAKLKRVFDPAGVLVPGRGRP